MCQDVILKNLMHIQNVFNGFPCKTCEDENICLTAEPITGFTDRVVSQMEVIITGRKKRTFQTPEMTDGELLVNLLVASLFGAFSSWVTDYVAQHTTFNLNTAIARFLIDLEEAGIDWKKVKNDMKLVKELKEGDDD